MEALHYRCGDYQVDVANRRFLHRDSELPLEPRVFAVIAQLLARSGELVARNELLDAVWGHRYVTPSALNRTIALARRAFGDDVAEPHFIQTVHGAGYRYIGPAEPLQAGELRVQARFGPPFAVRLPARIETLIGREQQLATLAALLGSHRAVTVLGAGGMGKTQCALEAARRAAADFPDGVWFFDLAQLQDAGQWLTQLGSVLEVRTPEPEILLQQLCALLHSRQALFVLDNCEGIAPELGALVHRLLLATESLRILSTSQRPLNLTGEWLFRLPPLAAPGKTADGHYDLQIVRLAPAVELLTARARAVRPEFEADAGNAAALAEICRRLDGMPLALELAASRFALLSPEQVLERLLQRFRFLESDSAGRAERHRSLRNLLDWSYALLTGDERRLLNWSAVFVHSWSTEALGALAATLGHDTETAVDLLSGLINHSMVTVITDVVPPRFRLLESVREYALLQLRNAGEEPAARSAHLAAMTKVCQSGQRDALHGQMRQAVERFTLESGNIQAALETAGQHDAEQPLALELLGALLLCSKAHGDYLTVGRWCRPILQPQARHDTPERARALLTLGVTQTHLVTNQSWIHDALPMAARIARDAGDWWTEAYACGYWALQCVHEGRTGEAEQRLLRLAELARTHGDELLLGLAGLVQGWVGLARGNDRLAVEALTAASGLGTDLHQHHFIAMYIGMAHFRLGENRDAAQSWLAALKVCASVSNARGMAGSLEGGSHLACRARRWTTAARLRAAALAIRERTQVPLFSFWHVHHQETLATLMSQLPEAEFAAVTRAGATMRLEDATNEALMLLEDLSQRQDAPSPQPNLPA